MRNLLLFAIVLLLSCNSKHSDYRTAEDALDAGREYISACLQGDFSKAAFYAVPDEKNAAVIKELEKTYRENDKEGRQQLRTASINISEVKDLSDTNTIIHYNNSFSKQPQILWVVKRNNTWLVDLNKN